MLGTHHLLVDGNERRESAFVFFAHVPVLDLAKAIARERTQLQTSGVGGIGCGVLPQGGYAPNFSLNLWAIHPGL